MGTYIHGYHQEEQARLREQADTLQPYIYAGIDLSHARNLLEVGSGVGAQTEILLEKYPSLAITCVEIAESQLQQAQANLSRFQNRSIEFVQQDCRYLHLSETFDAAFVCWVLEHIDNPLSVLTGIHRHLQPQGQIFVTEVMNSSFQFSPKLEGLNQYYQAYNTFQIENGGDPDIGLKLGNLLLQAGFHAISVQASGFHVDQSHPLELQKISQYWKRLLGSAASDMLQAGKITEAQTQDMYDDLDRIARDSNGVLFYRFIQASARSV